ncbi:SART3 [Bugula neritina]|uniref:SART3 n=1 Tax=Bugula neritina TaxID=10212 RepID=A0A7J7J489_BUGNE|nr:SART3 [Bugula neritina]
MLQEIWTDWLADEKELVDSKEDRQKLMGLYESAMQDYLSVMLWVDYCAYAIGLGDADKCRDIMTQATSLAGYHLTEGNYSGPEARVRDDLLQTMQPSIGSCSTPEQEAAINEQTERINSLYKQVISTPLVGIKSALAEYEQWIGEEISEELQESIKKLLILLTVVINMRMSWQAVRLQKGKANVYDTYITSYITHHPALTSCIRCLFERALAVNCLDQNIWIKYTLYLEKTMAEDSDVILSVYKRSLRNCPWSGALWVAYCLACEKNGETLEKLEGHMEAALQSGMQTSQDFLNVWTTYCDVIRRRINWAEIDSALLDRLRAVFERAIPHLLKYFGEEGDPDCALPKYWAMIEAKHCQNVEKSRQIWNDTMTGYRHDKAVAWLEFANFERCYGDYKHCRKSSTSSKSRLLITLNLSALSTSGSRGRKGPSVSFTLLSLELQTSGKRHPNIAKELKDRKPRFDNKKPSFKGGKHTQSKDTKHNKSQSKGSETSNQSNDGKHPKNQSNDKPSFKKPSQKTPQPKKDFSGKGERKSSNVNHEPVAVYKRKRNQSATGESETTPSDTADTPLFKMPEVPSGAPPAKKSKPSDEEKKADYSQTDNTTIFVSNLAYDVTESTLTDIFKQCGSVKEVRIMKGKGDKSKGFAYVEFDKVECVAPALALDRHPIEGRAMYVSPCNRKRSENTPKLKYETGMEKCKLFVSGLNYKTTAEQIKEEFAKHGNVKDVRLVTYKGGNSKGLAYVEFYEETDARKALLAMDAATFHDFTIKVAISNPPARKPPAASGTGYVPSLGGPSKQLQDRGKSKTQINLMPRVFQTKPSTPKPKTEKPSTGPTDTPSVKMDNALEAKPGPKLSNADFRTLLLSKK